LGLPSPATQPGAALVSRRGVVGLLSVLALTSSAPASAQSKASPGSAPAADSAYQHERFRGRLELGVGNFAAFSTGLDASDRSFSGTTLSWAVFAGGTVGETCSLGGTLSADHVYGLAAYDDGTGPVDASDLTFDHVLWGPALDCYFSKQGGLRVFAAVGRSELNVDAEGIGSSGSADATPDPSGLGYQLGVGYDAFVASELSLGLFFKLTYAPLDVTEVSGTATDVDVWLPTLGLSLTLD